jgi:poly(3-hydroxybutyrate) depolymerase
VSGGTFPRTIRISLPLLVCAGLCFSAGCAGTGEAPHTSGVIRFMVPTARGPLAVHAFLPERGAGDAPALIVMHGLQRDAQAYFQAWVGHARERRVVLVVPEFDKANWPTSSQYPLGNVMTPQGTVLGQDESAFAAVDLAVDEALRRAGRPVRSARLDLYGHGAGAQFVQRYVLHTGAPRIRMAIAANAGWYLLPETSFDFPYGLRNLPIPETRLRESFAVPLVVLLGQEDRRADGVIRQNAQTMAQGPDRLSRGRFFLDRAAAAAQRLGASLNWRLQEVPGAGHSDSDMLPTARALLSTGPIDQRPSR